MNFLELVQRLATETGTELEAKITTVAVPPAQAYGRTTEHRNRLVRWIQQAWLDIQDDQTQWNFMVQDGRMGLVEDQWVYPLPKIVDEDWYNQDPETHEEAIFDKLVPYVAPLDRRYIWMVNVQGTCQNRQLCYYIRPEHFFGDRDRHVECHKGVPSRYSIDRKGCIVFDSSPTNDDYHIEFEFNRLPQELTEDSDIPYMIDKRYHILIVYRAMVFYAGFDETGPQMQRAQKLYRDMMNKFRLRYLREYSMPGVR